MSASTSCCHTAPSELLWYGWAQECTAQAAGCSCGRGQSSRLWLADHARLPETALSLPLHSSGTVLSIVRDAGDLVDSINTATAVHRLGKVVRRRREAQPGGCASWSGWLPPLLPLLPAAAAAVATLTAPGLFAHSLFCATSVYAASGLLQAVLRHPQYRQLVGRVAELAPTYRPRGLANTLWGLAGAALGGWQTYRPVVRTAPCRMGSGLSIVRASPARLMQSQSAACYPPSQPWATRRMRRWHARWQRRWPASLSTSSGHRSCQTLCGRWARWGCCASPLWTTCCRG